MGAVNNWIQEQIEETFAGRDANGGAAGDWEVYAWDAIVREDSAKVAGLDSLDDLPAYLADIWEDWQAGIVEDAVRRDMAAGGAE
jgi:hypothetical protein